jgi:hypothetical protein
MVSELEKQNLKLQEEVKKLNLDAKGLKRR